MDFQVPESSRKVECMPATSSDVKMSAVEENSYSTEGGPRTITTSSDAQQTDPMQVSSPPSRSWAMDGSPMFRFPGSVSPIMRFGLPSPGAFRSPGAAFRSPDYTDKSLSDDPLLRIPSADPQHMFVDAHGELFTAGTDSHSLEVDVGLGFLPSAAASSVVNGPVNSKARGSDSTMGLGLLNSLKPLFTAPAGGTSKTVFAKEDAVEEEDQKDQSSLIARVGKGAAERKRISSAVGAGKDYKTGRPLSLKSMAQGECLFGKMGDRRKRRGESEGKTGGRSKKVSRAKGGRSTGSKEVSLLLETDLELTPCHQEYSEEELKRIRRVKNRASVEKCRTKQRKRMEALEIEMRCLKQENRNLEAVTKCVAGTSEAICMEVHAVTGKRPELNVK